MFTLGTLDLGLMILYVTGRYSGNYPEFISFIDNYAEMIWLFVSIIVIKYILHIPLITNTKDSKMKKQS